jgi:hypothetical protein
LAGFGCRPRLNENFTLGLQEGDTNNQLVGSLTGALIAGHVYRLDYLNEILSHPGTATDPGLAIGNLALTFVPGPATGTLILLGLAALAWRVRRLGA